jgi:cell division protein FtsN
MRAVAAVLIAAGLVVLASPVHAQLPIRTTTTTTARATSTTSTTAKSTTTTPSSIPATTAKPRPTTTRPTTTTTQQTTTTIATPAQAATTTSTTAPISRHSGHFSPLFSVLAFAGVLSGMGLLVLQWFLTKPGREGWTL